MVYCVKLQQPIKTRTPGRSLVLWEITAGTGTTDVNFMAVGLRKGP